MLLNALIFVALLLAIANVYFNFRIIRAYGNMSRKTSESLAITPESRKGFREFFALCGYGTHGVHVLHLLVDSVLLFTALVTPALLGPIVLYLVGVLVIHAKQAIAAEVVLKNFFTRDLAIIENLLNPPMAVSLDQLDDLLE